MTIPGSRALPFLLASNKKIVTVTDSAGYFSLKLPAAITGSIELLVTSIGYATQK
jgi:hypothetical protein